MDHGHGNGLELGLGVGRVPEFHGTPERYGAPPESHYGIGSVTKGLIQSR
jgi:hypothetical protein